MRAGKHEPAQASLSTLFDHELKQSVWSNDRHRDFEAKHRQVVRELCSAYPDPNLVGRWAERLGGELVRPFLEDRENLPSYLDTLLKLAVRPRGIAEDGRIQDHTGSPNPLSHLMGSPTNDPDNRVECVRRLVAAGAALGPGLDNKMLDRYPKSFMAESLMNQRSEWHQTSQKMDSSMKNIVQALVESGWDVNEGEEDDRVSPLAMAIINKQPIAVQAFLDNGARLSSAIIKEYRGISDAVDSLLDLCEAAEASDDLMKAAPVVEGGPPHGGAVL